MADATRARTALLVGLAFVGVAVSAVLAAFQLQLTGSPWEPLFGDGSRRVLTSDLSRSLPVPDAVMGVGLYAADAVLGAWLMRRPSGHRSVATLLAAIVSAGALVGVFLVAYQVLVVGALCTLCLGSALISWLLAGGALAEARSRWQASRRDPGPDAAAPRTASTRAPIRKEIPHA